jgi:hypothetical protein
LLRRYFFSRDAFDPIARPYGDFIRGVITLFFVAVTVVIILVIRAIWH